MTNLIPDASKGLAFHWTDLEGNRWRTNEGGIKEGEQAHEIAYRAVDTLLGRDRRMSELGKDLFLCMRAIAMEALLRDKSTKELEAA